LPAASAQRRGCCFCLPENEPLSLQIEAADAWDRDILWLTPATCIILLLREDQDAYL
jgi:hypothetical protein